MRSHEDRVKYASTTANCCVLGDSIGGHDVSDFHQGAGIRQDARRLSLGSQRHINTVAST